MDANILTKSECGTCSASAHLRILTFSSLCLTIGIFLHTNGMCGKFLIDFCEVRWRYVNNRWFISILFFIPYENMVVPDVCGQRYIFVFQRVSSIIALTLVASVLMRSLYPTNGRSNRNRIATTPWSVDKKRISWSRQRVLTS
jgi:hypothetical protein